MQFSGDFTMTATKMATYRPKIANYIHIIVFLTFISEFTLAAGQQQAPVAARPHQKIIIPRLPPSHYQFWLKSNPSALESLETICSEIAAQNVKSLNQLQSIYSNLTFEEPRYTTEFEFSRDNIGTICSRINLVKKSCWGYENNCEIIYLMPECHPSSSDSRSEQEKKINWFNQADFGYILNRRWELTKYCTPDKHANHSTKSSFQCTKYFRTCRGENLYLKFDTSTSLKNHRDGPVTLKQGQVGGWNCDLQKKLIEDEGTQAGFLKSWYNELKHYDLMMSNQPTKACEEHIDKQVYFIQLDSNTNMYHYFCNFINLYATMHLNNRFSEDNILLIWDNKLPDSPFEDMWSVFSKNPLASVRDFGSKQVCFKRFIFSMPPKMTNGLYYNIPLVNGCFKSGLFDAFNKHVLYKLGIQQDHYSNTRRDSQLRVTIVSRSTPTRKILNEIDLKSAIDNISNEYSTRIVDFTNMTFLDQLTIAHNTDILVGVHGSGLTHTLFLPDWAALIELHNCKDERYRDLARLRGVKYFTLKNRDNTADKSTDISINLDDFIETLRFASAGVKQHKYNMEELNMSLSSNSALQDEEENASAKVDPVIVRDPEAIPRFDSREVETEKTKPELNQAESIELPAQKEKANSAFESNKVPIDKKGNVEPLKRHESEKIPEREATIAKELQPKEPPKQLENSERDTNQEKREAIVGSGKPLVEQPKRVENLTGGADDQAREDIAGRGTQSVEQQKRPEHSTGGNDEEAEEVIAARGKQAIEPPEKLENSTGDTTQEKREAVVDGGRLVVEQAKRLEKSIEGNYHQARQDTAGRSEQPVERQKQPAPPSELHKAFPRFGSEQAKIKERNRANVHTEQNDKRSPDMAPTVAANDQLETQDEHKSGVDLEDKPSSQKRGRILKNFRQNRNQPRTEL